MTTNFDDDAIQGSLFGLFAESQETLDDAKRKNASESNVKTQYLQLTSDGTYAVRILPLAPVIGEDGTPLPMKRKGYEYPLKDIFLKIQGTDKKGKTIVRHIPVCHTSLAFPELKQDLIDLYVQLACDANANDSEFCSKLKGTSFNGGLKYNSKRCMYVYDMSERSKGAQILQLSYSQYKELEEAKLRLWGKLAQKNNKVLCPISSPMGAYPVEITRKTEKKTSYSISIDTISGTDALTQEELQALLDAPRLPEVLYVYRRFHLEATIEFLKQLDEQFGLDIMSSQAIQDCIDQIKMCLPADDQSHFTFNSDDSEGNKKGGKVTLEELWDMFDDLEDKGLGDRSEEGQKLRTLLREFIEDNDLDIRIDRKKTNHAVLTELQELYENEPEDDDDSDIQEPEEDPTEDLDEPEVEEGEVEEEEEETSPRRSRNDDTNEPAARAPRRAPRSPRRR